MTEPEHGPLAFVRLNLPDGRMAMQRRTADAPTSPNKLQFFGGHMKQGETLLQAALRELEEKTDLPVRELSYTDHGFFWSPKPYGLHPVYGFLSTSIISADFADYEGTGTPEVWDAADALQTGQLVLGVQYFLDKITMIEHIL